MQAAPERDGVFSAPTMRAAQVASVQHFQGRRSDTRACPTVDRSPLNITGANRRGAGGDLADRVIAGLQLSGTAQRTVEPAPPPLPMIELPTLFRDNSLLFSLVRLDSSNRINDQRIVDALGWQCGDRLDAAVVSGLIVIRAAASGSLRMPNKRRITVPIAACLAASGNPGEQVLIAAAPAHAVLIVYTMAALNRIIIAYHDKPQSSDQLDY